MITSALLEDPLRGANPMRYLRFFLMLLLIFSLTGCAHLNGTQHPNGPQPPR
jgi:hypothetical protein